MARRTASNQLEMEYQAKTKAFRLKYHPCTPHCEDRRCACQTGCEKYREYREKYEAFCREAFTAKVNEKYLVDIAETAKKRNSERT